MSENNSLPKGHLSQTAELCENVQDTLFLDGIYELLGIQGLHTLLRMNVT